MRCIESQRDIIADPAYGIEQMGMIALDIDFDRKIQPGSGTAHHSIS